MKYSFCSGDTDLLFCFVVVIVFYYFVFFVCLFVLFCFNNIIIIIILYSFSLHFLRIVNITCFSYNHDDRYTLNLKLAYIKPRTFNVNSLIS